MTIKPVTLDMVRRVRLDELNRQYQTTLAVYFPHSNFVAGVGSLSPKVLFIGEAPGEEEDKQALPFVGPSGVLLNELLASVDIDRDDCYITNLVKYRPKDNRDPNDLEVNASAWFIRKEVQILHPRCIVTLGRFATGTFYQAAGPISQMAGKWRVKGIGNTSSIFVPMYHPAAAIRDPKIRKKMFEHIKVVKVVSDHSKKLQREYHAEVARANGWKKA